MQTSASDLEVLDALADMRAELVALRADLRAYGVMRADVAQTSLIEAINAACPRTIFLASELLTIALREDPAARRLMTLLAGKSTRAVGKALSDASNMITQAGLVIRHVDDCNAGALWCVTRV